ncbi:Uncharacterised protein [Vibrio cholerae]|nr:Uncharacterised protein [Vibrio cholerae]
MENPGFPIFKIVLRILLVFKLKQLYANAISG